jgi:predicted O-methyltransferase YrrM
VQWDWEGVWDGNVLHLNGLTFSVDYRADTEHPEGAFRVHKSRSMVRDEMSIIHPRAPLRILELGTKTGGSAVMWAELLKPGKVVTVDLEDERLVLPGVRAYRGVDQADERALREIVGSEFDGELDIILDDASHLYEPTKASFDCLFPLLRPAGLYLIEDWDWEMFPDFKRPDFWGEDAEGLVRLIVELARHVRDEGGTIQGVSLHRSFAVVERA